jgi:hypothetical protein
VSIAEETGRRRRVGICSNCGEVEILRYLNQTEGVCARCVRRSREDAKGIAEYLRKTADPDIRLDDAVFWTAEDLERKAKEAAKGSPQGQLPNLGPVDLKAMKEWEKLSWTDGELYEAGLRATRRDLKQCAACGAPRAWWTNKGAPKGGGNYYCQRHGPDDPVVSAAYAIKGGPTAKLKHPDGRVEVPIGADEGGALKPVHTTPEEQQQKFEEAAAQADLGGAPTYKAAKPMTWGELKDMAKDVMDGARESKPEAGCEPPHTCVEPKFDNHYHDVIDRYRSLANDPKWSAQPSDPVHRPSHYRRGGYELIDVLEAWGLDRDGYIMQAVQYLFRAGLKGTTKLEDYRKALWYLERRIATLERDADA